MKQTIVEALLEYEKINKKNELDQKREKKQARQNLLGYKDYSQSNSRFKRLLEFGNDVQFFFKIMFLPKEKIDGSFATLVLLKFFLTFLIDLISFGLAVISVIIFLCIPLQYFMPDITPLPWGWDVLYGLCALMVFFLSKFFHIASVEIEKSEDNNYLFGVFTSVTSAISLVIAIIAIIKKS